MAADNDLMMISFQIPTKTATALTEKAAKEGISRSALIRDLLVAGLKRRVDPGSELRRLRKEMAHLREVVEASIGKRR